MRSSAIRILLVLAGLAIVLCVSGVSWGLLRFAQAAPTLTACKDDYDPTETVTITGGGFAPDTLYDIPVIRPDDSIVTGDGSGTPGWDTVQSDESGAFTYVYNLDGIPGTYQARAYLSPWSGDLAETPIATVTFTDGNVKVFSAPSGVTFTLTATGFSTTDCSGTGSTDPPFGTFYGVGSSSGTGKTFGVGSTESVKLEAAATSDQGGSFINWTSDYTFTDLGGGVICVPGFTGGGSRDYYANYGGTATPTSTHTPTPVPPTPTYTDTPTPVPPTPTYTDTPTPVPPTPTYTDTPTPVPPTPTYTRTPTPVLPTATFTPAPTTPPPPGVGGIVKLPPAAVAAESVTLPSDSRRPPATYATLAGVTAVVAAGLILSLAVLRPKSR